MKKILAILLALAFLLGGCANAPASTPAVSTAPTVSNCDHADANDDGSCDLCSASVLVPLDFYSINDLHGKLADGDNHIGVDELTTFLKNKQQTENTILLSAGDMWQGTPESNLTHGREEHHTAPKRREIHLDDTVTEDEFKNH